MVTQEEYLLIDIQLAEGDVAVAEYVNIRLHYGALLMEIYISQSSDNTTKVVMHFK
jgi:hypothetical protein